MIADTAARLGASSTLLPTGQLCVLQWLDPPEVWGRQHVAARGEQHRIAQQAIRQRQRITLCNDEFACE
jgi:hypothetical protein